MIPSTAPAPDEHKGEQTLMAMKPTRYIALGYYLLFIVFLILAPLVYFRPWFFDAIPRAPVGPMDTSFILAVVLLVLALYCLVRAELRRATTSYVITDNKIVRKDGILNKNTQMIPYTQLERIDLNQTLGQRILHIGTVVVDTGDDTLKIGHIAHPEKVQQLLSDRLGRKSYSQQK